MRKLIVIKESELANQADLTNSVKSIYRHGHYALNKLSVVSSLAFRLEREGDTKTADRIREIVDETVKEIRTLQDITIALHQGLVEGEGGIL